MDEGESNSGSGPLSWTYVRAPVALPTWTLWFSWQQAYVWLPLQLEVRNDDNKMFLFNNSFTPCRASAIVSPQETSELLDIISGEICVNPMDRKSLIQRDY